MLVEHFDRAAALADAVCPRCHAVGLQPIAYDTLAQAPEQDRHASRYSVEPSIAARCPSCGLVGEWPGMSWGEAL